MPNTSAQCVNVFRPERHYGRQAGSAPNAWLGVAVAKPSLAHEHRHTRTYTQISCHFPGTVPYPKHIIFALILQAQRERAATNRKATPKGGRVATQTGNRSNRPAVPGKEVLYVL